MASFEAIKICTLRMVQPSSSLQVISHVLCIVLLKCCYLLMVVRPYWKSLRSHLSACLGMENMETKNVWGNKLIHRPLYSAAIFLHRKYFSQPTGTLAPQCSLKPKIKHRFISNLPCYNLESMSSACNQ